jgi:Phage integrase, N-terminal SAM-like domain
VPGIFKKQALPMHSAHEPGGDVHRPIDTHSIVGGFRLLGGWRDLIGRKHFGIRIEQAYLDWTKGHILFHGKRHPRDMGDQDVMAFLNHLARVCNVVAWTQGQALKAISEFELRSIYYSTH